MSYTFDLSNTTGTTNPAQQSPAGNQFLPWWLNVGGQVISQGGQFLASAPGTCWQLHPPFSGRGDQRRQCLERVAAGQIYSTQIGTHGTSNLASVGNLAAIGLVGFLGYQLLKK